MLRMLSVSFLCALAGCQATGRPPTTASDLVPTEASTPYALSDATQRVIRTSVASELKDPYSARFGYMAGARQGAIVVVCGTVNAKNSYGGYTGPRWFYGAYVPSTNKFAMIALAEDSSTHYAVLKMCKRDLVDAMQ